MQGLIEKAYAYDFTDVIGLKQGNTSISSLVTTVINWMLYVAGIVAFFYLIWAGFTYITANGNPEQAKKGQQGLINAIIGILIISLSFVILQAVGNAGKTGNISEIIRPFIA